MFEKINLFYNHADKMLETYSNLFPKVELNEVKRKHLVSILIYQSHLPLFSIDNLPYFRTNENNDEILVLFDGNFDGKYICVKTLNGFDDSFYECNHIGKMNIPLKEDLKIDELTVYENLETQFYEMFNKKMDSLNGFNLFKRIYVSFLQKEPFNMYFKKGTHEVVLFENEK